MKKQFHILRSTIDQCKTSLIEIICDRRVLIERHRGISEYSNRRVTVKKHQGSISINGEDLQLMLISDESVVVTGKIHCVELHDERE